MCRLTLGLAIEEADKGTETSWLTTCLGRPVNNGGQSMRLGRKLVRQGAPSSARRTRLSQFGLLLPAATGLLVLSVYPLREAGGLFSAGIVRHAFGLSGPGSLLVAAYLGFRRQRVKVRPLEIGLMAAGALLGGVACLLYLPLELALIALLATQSVVLVLFLAQRAGAQVLTRMRLRWLRQLTILMPPTFILIVTLTIYAFHIMNAIGHRTEHLALTAILFAGTFPFAVFVFRVFEHIQNEIVGQRDELARLHEEATYRSRQLRLINDAGLDLTSVLSLEVRARRLVDLGRELTGASDGSLLILDAGKPGWILVSGGSCVNLAGRLMSWSEAEEKSCGCQLCDRLIPWPSLAPPRDDTIVVPLQWQTETLGLLTLAHASDRTFTADERELIGMYAQWGTLAIKNAQLFQQVRALAVMEERDRIAREMHDNFGQMLGYINTKAQAVGLLLTDARLDEAGKQLVELGDTAQELYEDVREEISGLRATRWLDQGLSAALENYAHQFQDANGIRTSLSMDMSRPLTLSLDAELQVFRIVQEALANVRKHAQAPTVTIRVYVEDERLVVSVKDEGRGFLIPTNGGGRFGLRTMKERAEELRGYVNINSAPGAGTTVTLDVPLPSSEARWPS